MENYRVQIDNDNWFSVDSKIIESGTEVVRIINLRSIKGFIGGESFDLSDNQLKKLIMDYLTYSNNVELLNIYSRKFNGFNWFEIYNDVEFLIKQFENDHPVYTGCSKTNENSELLENIKNSEKFDSSKISSDIKGKNNLLIPNKLYENMNVNLPKFQKLNLDDMKFIPIWYINGSRTSRAEYTELFTTFEILIHILSKRFITFKSQLLSISSTEIQYATEKGYGIERYLKIEKESLAELLLHKDKKIDELTKINKELLAISQRLDKSNQELINKVDSLKLDNQNLINQNNDLKQDNQNLNNKVDGLKLDNQEIKQKLDDHKQVLDVVAENVTQMTENMFNNQTEFEDSIINNFPKNYISTRSTDELFILLNRASLNDEIHKNYEGIGPDDIILDSISCQKRDKSSNLSKHEFDSARDKIVFKSKHGNSLDFNKFVQDHKDLIEPLNDRIKTNNKYIRKFIIKEYNLELLRQELLKIINQSNNPRKELIEINNKSIQQVVDPLKNISNAVSKIQTSNEETKINLDLMIQKITNQINKKFEELNNKIDKNTEDLKIVKQNTELILEQQVTINEFKQIFGDVVVEVFKNHKYRTINKGEKYMKYPSYESRGKPVKEEFLTIDDLLHARFRSSDGKTTIVINKDLINKIKKMMNGN